MNFKKKISTIDTCEISDRKKLEYIADMLSQFQGMATTMELETLAYLLEMSLLETKLQIEIDDYS